MKKEKILQLIVEDTEPEFEILKEAFDPSKPKTLKFKGIFMKADVRNGNDRIYPYEEMKPEVDRFIKEMVQTNRALMELEHPDNVEINPERSCARILSLTEDKHSWIGEAVILCSDEKFGVKGTPTGDVLAGIAAYGTKFGVSSRAMGDVSKTGVVTNLHLVTCDVVMNPSIGEMVASNGNRFVNGILESKQFVVNQHGQIVERAYGKLEKSLSKLPNTHISSKKNAAIASALHDFFEGIVA